MTTDPSGGEEASPAALRRMLEYMLLHRVLEERIVALYRQGRIVGGVYTGLGQEAIGVGIAVSLTEGDVIFPSHRDLGAYLVRGITPTSVLAHYLGRQGGPTRGRDANLHMGDWTRGVGAFISHMADTVPVAAGVALSFKLRRQASVVVCMTGDGATSRGDWYEGINFAAVQKVPAVFVCVNNRYAYSTPIERQMAVGTVAERASGFGIPVETVDGTDVLAVYRAGARAIRRARERAGPSFLECVAYRMTGHSAADNADYVPPRYFEAGEAADPIARFEAWLRDTGTVEQAEIDRIRASVRSRVENGLREAEASPEPESGEAQLLEGVYAPSPGDAERRPER